MKFNFDTIKDFDEHINLSIPHYASLLEIITSLASYFIKPGSYVYDLGCSTGAFIKRLSIQYDNMARFIGIDASANLLPKDKEGNVLFDAGVNLNYYKADVLDFDYGGEISLALSIFTLQFLRIQDRIKLLSRIHKGMIPEGAFIVVEKIYEIEGFIEDLFTFSYYDFKERSFTAETILSKQKDLREIMRPLSYFENESLFINAGFRPYQFFRSLNFVGWVLIPDSITF